MLSLNIVSEMSLGRGQRAVFFGARYVFEVAISGYDLGASISVAHIPNLSRTQHMLETAEPSERPRRSSTASGRGRSDRQILSKRAVPWLSVSVV